MATINANIPVSLDNYTFEGGFDAGNGRVAAKEILNSRVSSGTTLGAQRVGSNDGDVVTIGTTTDAAYAGSGGASLVALLKSLYTLLTTANTNTAHLAARAGYESGSGATSTTGGTDYTYTFSAQVNHWFVQNNTSAAVQFELDAATSAGSPVIAAGATWASDVPVTAIHLLTASSQNVNGTTGGNIVVKGWI